eukprot:SAG31_NODE_1746_length_7364_cov_6.205231_3_plen_1017_part_00
MSATGAMSSRGRQLPNRPLPVKPNTPAQSARRGSGNGEKHSIGTAESDEGSVASAEDENALGDTDSLGFAHLDDVCIKLLKKGNKEEAIKYLTRMRGMIDSICKKLEPQPPAPVKPTAPTSARRARSATKGLRSGRLREQGSAPSESADGGSSSAALLPAIVRRDDPVDTAAERLAAKDKHIDSLKQQLADVEAKTVSALTEAKEQRAKVKEAVSRLKKRDEELTSYRASLRREGREGDDAREEVAQLRGLLETARQNAQPPPVSVDEHADALQQIYQLQQKLKKTMEALKKGETKQKVLSDQLSVARDTAEKAKEASKVVESYNELQAALKQKKDALKRSAETVTRRDAQIEALAAEKMQLEETLESAAKESQSQLSELASVKRRLDQTMEEYKSMRTKVAELTSELNSADMASTEMQSLKLQLADAEQIVLKMAMKSEKSEKKLVASGVELHNSAKAMKAMSDELSTVKGQLEEMKVDTVKVRKRVAPLKADVERLNKLVIEKQEKVELLQDTSGKRMQKLLDELDRLREQVLEIPKLQDELAEKVKEGHTAAQRLEDMQLRFEEFAEQSKELKDFEAERNAWARKLVRLSIEPPVLRQRIAQQANTMKLMEADITRLEVALIGRELTDTLADEESAAMRAELLAARHRIQTLEEEQTADRSELEVRATIIARHENELAVLRAEVDSLRQQGEVAGDVATLEQLLVLEQERTTVAKTTAEQERVKAISLGEQLAATEQANADLRAELTAESAALADRIARLERAEAECAQENAAAVALRAELSTARDETQVLARDKSRLDEELAVAAEKEDFMNAEFVQLHNLVNTTREEVRQREDVISRKDSEIAQQKEFLQLTIDRMQREKLVALEMEIEGRERMRMALQKAIAHRQTAVHRAEVLASERLAEAEAATQEAARLEAIVAELERELAEAVVPLVVTEAEQHAVAEAVEEMICSLELLERVSDRQTHLYVSGAATTSTPNPTATPELVEMDYSRPLANPVVSVRTVRTKRLYSI